MGWFDKKNDGGSVECFESGEPYPVAWGVYNKAGKIGFVTLYPEEYPNEKFVPLSLKGTKLHDWVYLTNDEIKKIWGEDQYMSNLDFSRRVERAFKEKNDV